MDILKHSPTVGEIVKKWKNCEILCNSPMVGDVYSKWNPCILLQLEKLVQSAKQLMCFSISEDGMACQVAIIYFNAINVMSKWIYWSILLQLERLFKWKNCEILCNSPMVGDVFPKWKPCILLQLEKLV